MKKTDWLDVIGKIDPVYVKEAEQWNKAAQKKRMIKHFTAMAACVCALLVTAAVSFELYVQQENRSGTESTKSNESAVNVDGAVPEAAEESAAEATEVAEQIIVNEVSELKAYAIDIGYESEKVLDAEELTKYYGVTIFPDEIPEDLVAVTGTDTASDGAETSGQPELLENKQSTTQTEEKESSAFTGRLYYTGEEIVGDDNTFYYENEDKTRVLTISVRTKESDVLIEFEDENLTTSNINGTEVTIARLDGDDGNYIAIFTKEGVTFTIQTKNLTERELIMILRGLC